MVAVVALTGACQSGGTPVATDGTTDQASPAVPTSSSSGVETGTSEAAGTPVSITATVTYPWTPLINSSVDAQPQSLNAKADTTCSMEKQVETCDSPGPFKGDPMTIVCFDETEVGGIIGVVLSKEQLVRPDQVRFQSRQGDLPVGFTTVNAIGDWDYMLFKGLAEKLGATVEDGLQCEKHTTRVR
ncbi:hypothetical protein [Actinosynnema sp. NPDC023587]|uniref:hypothetical protein n=1 Tax=Actinosynnema sp. NPDC023587 TaxID=3154695 RepID=UPI0033D5E5C3